MFRQKKVMYEILENLEKKVDEYMSSAEDDISRNTERLSEIDKDADPWNFTTYTEWLEDAQCRRKAAQDILKQLEKIFG